MSIFIDSVCHNKHGIWTSRYLLDCSAWCNATIRYYCPPSFSVCEQAEKLEVLDHAFSVTSMAASIGQ